MLRVSKEKLNHCLEGRGGDTWIQCDTAEDMVEGRESAQGGYCKYYKQQSTKSELVEDCYMGDIPHLKVLRWQNKVQSQVWQHALRILGVTRRRNRWCLGAAEFPAQESGSWLNQRPRGLFSVLCCHKLGTSVGSSIHLAGTQQKAEPQRDTPHFPKRNRLGPHLRSLSNLEFLKTNEKPKKQTSDTCRVNTVFCQKLGREDWLSTFQLGLSGEWRAWIFSSKATEGGPAIFLPHISSEIIHGVKQWHLPEAGKLTPNFASLCPWGTLPQIREVLSYILPHPTGPHQKWPV